MENYNKKNIHKYITWYTKRLIGEPPVAGVLLAEEFLELLFCQIPTLVEQESVLIHLVVLFIHVFVINPLVDYVVFWEFCYLLHRPGGREGPWERLTCSQQPLRYTQRGLVRTVFHLGPLLLFV